MRVRSFASFLLVVACSSSTPRMNTTDAAGFEDRPALDAEDAHTPDAAATHDDNIDVAPSVPRIEVVVSEGSTTRVVTTLPYAAPFVVRASGLAAGETVALEARTPGYRSHAVFVADPVGVVDVSRDAPMEGSYEGVDADGLLWSMRRELVTAPVLDVDFVLMRGSDDIATVTLHRTALNDGLLRRDVHEDGLVGALYVPTARANAPTVIVLGGSNGGTPLFTASYLGSLGYAAFALAYFGEAGLPTTLDRVPLEYFDRARAWLDRQTDIDTDRLALVGQSRGGELVLLLAARGFDADAVIAVAPSAYRWPDARDGARSAWTIGGIEVPYIPPSARAEYAYERLPNGAMGARSADTAFRRSLDDAAPSVVSAATSPIERASGDILMIGGADDGVWPSCTFIERAWAMLDNETRRASHADEHVCLPDAGHTLGVPGWSTEDSYAAQVGGRWLVSGGTVAGNGRANRELDRRIRAFLARTLR